jgi:hypothetical protein
MVIVPQSCEDTPRTLDKSSSKKRALQPGPAPPCNTAGHERAGERSLKLKERLEMPLLV